MSYDAFISYSHGSDLELAKVVRDRLQRLAKPWNRRRALSVFLDQSSLELSSELGDSLEQRIDDTDWLVLFMSEASAQSKWVGAEISQWAEAKSKDRLLLVLTSGEIACDDRAKEFDLERSTAVNAMWRARACELAGRNITEEEWEIYGDGGTRVVHCPEFDHGEGDVRVATEGLKD